MSDPERRRRTASRAAASADAPDVVLDAARCLVMAVVAVLPLPLGADRDWIWPWFALPVGLAAVLVAMSGLRGRLAFSGNGTFLWLLAAWSAWAVAYSLPVIGGWLAPIDRAAASREGLKSVLFALLAALVVIGFRSRIWMRRLLLTVFVAGAFEAAYGAFMVLSGIEYGAFGPKNVGRGVATGTFVNRNHLAGCLELAASVGFGLLIGSLADPEVLTWRQRLRAWMAVLLSAKVLQRALLAVIVVGLVLTQSRMGNAGFMLSLAAVGVAGLLLIRPLPRMLLWLLASIVLVDTLVLGSWVGVDRLADRLRQTDVPTVAVAADGSAGPGMVLDLGNTDEERYEVSRIALDMWRARPWVGFGPGGFRVGFPAFKSDRVAVFYDHAHNDWVETLAERGIIGTGLWVALLLVALVQSLLAVRRRRDPAMRGAGLAAFGCIVSLGAHALFDFNWQIPANLAWFVVLLAAGTVAAEADRRR